MSSLLGLQLPTHRSTEYLAPGPARPLQPSALRHRSDGCLVSTLLPGLQRPVTAYTCQHASTSRGKLQVQCAIKKGSEKNVICSKTLTGKPDMEAQVLQRCSDIVDFSKGRMSVRSSGILAFEAMQDRFDKNVFHFWERYDSNVSMGRHNNTAEMQAFMVEMQNLLEGPIGIALYEWKDGKIGQQCIQGGPKGEGGLDDATGAGGAGGASMKQSSNTVDLGKVKRGDEGDAFGMGFKFPWQKKKGEK